MECIGDEDCIEPTPFCHLQFGTCVECENELDCRTDSKCNAICFEGICEPSSIDCTQNPTLKICDVQGGECGACAVDADCKNALMPHCGSGVCSECNDDYHCRDNTDCNAYCEEGNCKGGNLDCTANPINKKCITTKTIAQQK